jgi:MFS family permease
MAENPAPAGRSCLRHILPANGIRPNRDIFIVSRLVAGIGVGMASMLSPMYIAEIAPAAYRGRMVAINQLTIVLGILVTNLVNYTLRDAG